MQRLFVAVEIPPEVCDHLAERLASVRRELPGWRWSDPSRWHLTVAFLGDVAPAALPELSRRLGRAAARHGSFELGLGRLGAFSRPARARVLWIGVATGREPLVRLAASVSAAARRSKIAMEDRAYRPHLTLGRRTSPVDVRDQVALGAELSTPTWGVSSFTLVESHLGPQVRHDVVERFELAASR